RAHDARPPPIRHPHGQVHFAEIVPDPHAHAVTETAWPRVVGMDLERRRLGVGRAAAEGRGRSPIRRGRDQDERERRPERPIVGQSRAVFLFDIWRRELYLTRLSLRAPAGEYARVRTADRRQERSVLVQVARWYAAQGGVGGLAGIVHQLRVAGAEDRIVDDEARGRRAEDLGVRQRLALRRDDGLGALQPVRAVRGEQVVV